MKKIISTILFCALMFSSIQTANNVLLDKSYNRYYMLEYELAQRNETYDIQIFGSCHAYTSFIPGYLSDVYDVTAYNMSSPGECIPVTYLRMLERFKIDVPKAAIVEIWGVNPYETYDSTENILGGYMQCNLELLPLSWEKIEVINDFDTLDLLSENFPIAKYKARITSQNLTEADWNYSFELANKIYNTTGKDYIYVEMQNRFSNNGYKSCAAGDVSDYAKMQGNANGESLAVEKDIMKYVEKIITLCQEYDVPLFFYRAPYRATDNELKKANYLKEYFDDRSIPFFDLEECIAYDYSTDFLDYEHLSYNGAYKSTVFLGDYVMASLAARNNP